MDPVTYYKAVQPDYTDFYSGKVHYNVGETVRHPMFSAYPSAFTSTVPTDPMEYLSVATVPTDCTGMMWPCRLLEVAPDRPWNPNRTLLPNKRACLSMRVVRELDPKLALGPQADDIVRLMELISSIEVNQLMRSGLRFRDYLYWEDFNAHVKRAWIVALKHNREAAMSATRSYVFSSLYKSELGRISHLREWMYLAQDLAMGAMYVYLVKDIIGQESETYQFLTDPVREIFRGSEETYYGR